MGIVHPYAYLRTYKHNVCKVVKNYDSGQPSPIRERYRPHGKNAHRAITPTR